MIPEYSLDPKTAQLNEIETLKSIYFDEFEMCPDGESFDLLLVPHIDQSCENYCSVKLNIRHAFAHFHSP
jgi:hypothetical protein